MSDKKPALKSKTIWFNLIVIVLLFIGAYPYPESWRPVTDHLTQFTAFLAALGNVILRFLTDNGIEMKETR